MDSFRSKENLIQFETLFGKTNSPIRHFQAPARINIIGEHVDYLGGIVLPAAIDFSVHILIRVNPSGQYRFYSVTYKDFIEVKTPFTNQENSPWVDYILGVIVEINKLGYEIPGFDLFVDGNIPQGSGLSSSAAFEVAVGFGLSQLFELKIPKQKIAIIGKDAENNFVGTKCGIMDQFIIAMGQKNKCISLNTDSLEFNYHQFDLEDYEFYLINSNVKHNLKDSAYNKRRQECESSLSKIQKFHPKFTTLYSVDLTEKQLEDCGLDMTEMKRTKYVLSEKIRTSVVIKALTTNDFTCVGNKLFETHWSLSQEFEVSCEEVDYLVEYLKKLGVTGARMIGGGFGGCVLVLDKFKNFSNTSSEIKKSYQQKFGLQTNFYKFQISDGVKEVTI
ncbi:galactokinase [Leptospira sp. 96542]|nr:galactokinase [Leptospira sp. 96542]